MPDYEPEKQELASRDVVSRRMTEHMKRASASSLRTAPIYGWTFAISAKPISRQSSASV